MANFETSTFFDDPDLVRFLRSMPFRMRRDVAIRAIGRPCVLYVGLLLAPAFMLFGYFCHLLGAHFGAESIGSIIGLLTCASLTGYIFSLYRNRKLREFIEAESRERLLVICPACYKPQALGAHSTCDCGCIVRPFSTTTSRDRPCQIRISLRRGFPKRSHLLIVFSEMRKAVILLTLAVLTGCNHSPPDAPDNALTEKPAEVSIFSDPDSFEDVTIQLIDSKSFAPIIGATIRVLCLGGTPHVDSSDTSGETGLATVTYWKGDIVGIAVEHAGYRPEMRFVSRADPVLKLIRQTEE